VRLLAALPLIAQGGRRDGLDQRCGLLLASGETLYHRPRRGRIVSDSEIAEVTLLRTGVSASLRRATMPCRHGRRTGKPNNADAWSAVHADLFADV
jgi:hypothetical protein